MRTKTQSVVSYIPIVLTALLTLILTFFILYNANWGLGDQLQFLKTTALNEFLPITNYVIPELGRFFPLGLMDYNILVLIPGAETALGHYTLNAISFLLMSFFLLMFYIAITKEYTKLLYGWIVLFVVGFIQSRMYIVYLDLIFPERIMSLMLATVLFFTYKFVREEKWIYGVVSLLAAAYALYCKEPMFGAFLVFSITQLLFGRSSLSKKQKIFHYILIALSVFYIILYYFLVFRNLTGMYSGSHGESDTLSIILRMINSHKIIVIALVLFFIRLIKIFKEKNQFNLFFDGLLFSGLAYFGACLLLQLNFTYYYLPAIILFTPSIVYYLIKYIKPVATLVVLGVIFAFYTFKLPGYIQSSQNARITTYPKMEKIAMQIQSGYEPIWISPQNNSDVDEWDYILFDWKRTSVDSYLAYILRDKELKSSLIDGIDEVDKPAMIFITEYNHDVNPQVSDNYTKIEQIMGIDVFVRDEINER